MSRKPKFKNDYVNTSLGPFPKEWKVVPLKDAVIYEKQSLDPQEYCDEKFEYYSIPAYSEHGKPIPEYGKEIRSTKLIVDKRTILFGKLNPRVPKVWHVISDTQKRRIASTEFIPLKSREGISYDKYLYYLAWSEFLLPKSQELVSGSTPSRQRVDVSAFLDVPVPLPPLPEQRAIANVLSTVRQAIEATDGVIAAARELKRLMMKHLFTYGTVPVHEADQVALKETEIGEIPEEWEVRKIGELADVNYGKGNPKSDGSVPVVGSGGIYDWTDEPLVNHPTIIIGRKGTAGRAWLMEDPSYPSDTTFYLDWKMEVDIKFLFNYLRLRPLSGEHAKTTIPSLTRPDLENKKVCYPPLLLQKTISDKISIVENKIMLEGKIKIALEGLFISLLHHLMTGKIKVNL